jgi:hypothetical protein
VDAREIVLESRDLRVILLGDDYKQVADSVGMLVIVY